jgi:hypothetical protein
MDLAQIYESILCVLLPRHSISLGFMMGCRPTLLLVLAGTVESTVHLLKQEKKGRREEREKERKTKE